MSYIPVVPITTTQFTYDFQSLRQIKDTCELSMHQFNRIKVNNYDKTQTVTCFVSKTFITKNLQELQSHCPLP